MPAKDVQKKSAELQYHHHAAAMEIIDAPPRTQRRQWASPMAENKTGEHTRRCAPLFQTILLLRN
jgi:hypothetical protein